MINTADYFLPDIQLLKENQQHYLVWIPDKSYIVLGASNHAEDSLHIENVKQDQIMVMKRPSGGQTVMLTPNNLIISAVYFNPGAVQPKEVFHSINTMIISVLELAGIENLSMNGISDISIAGKKILGSAIYSSKDALLYHAVLNLGEPSSTFERYLKHPVKEPDYRKGRKHGDFVTSLKEKGFSESYSYLANKLSQTFEASFHS